MRCHGIEMIHRNPRASSIPLEYNRPLGWRTILKSGMQDKFCGAILDAFRVAPERSGNGCILTDPFERRFRVAAACLVLRICKLKTPSPATHLGWVRPAHQMNFVASQT